jgi:precorrin-4/cobalt-precorrin-4 C11-methyltransferase
MKVYFVGAGPGDPELLTVRAERLLTHCALCIYAGSLVSPAVIGLIPAGAERHDSARMSLSKIVDVFRKAQETGRDVVRLHSGDPSLYGAIGEQMNALDEMGIDYEVVPGVSSFQAAAAALRTELTAPEISQTVILTRGAGRTPLPKKQELSRLAETKATLCIFLSVHTIREIAGQLIPHYGVQCPVAVVHRASWPEQEIYRGTLADIADLVEAAGIKSTTMIIVGEALSRNLPPSRLYSDSFSHGFRKGDDA